MDDPVLDTLIGTTTARAALFARTRDALVGHWAGSVTHAVAAGLLADGVMEELRRAEGGAYGAARTERIAGDLLRACGVVAAGAAAGIDGRTLHAERSARTRLGLPAIRVVGAEDVVAAAQLSLLAGIAPRIAPEWVSWPGRAASYRDLPVPDSVPALIAYLDGLLRIGGALIADGLAFHPRARPLVALLDAAALQRAPVTVADGLRA